MTDRRLEIARRYALARPGMTLLDCEPVGLPYFLLTLDSLILECKDTPVLEEFALEAVHAGLDTVDDMSAFLGVDPVMVESAVAAQYQADSLDYLPLPGGGRRRLSLTLAGKQVRESLRMITPKRADLTIAFDRLLWRPTDVRRNDLLRPKDAKGFGLRLISPRYAKKPPAEELSVDEVEKVIGRVIARDALTANILRIIAVTRAETRFRLGDLLVFQPEDGQDLQVMVAIDGRLAPAHEDALNQLGGARFVGISPTPGSLEQDETVELPSELVAERVPLANVRRAQVRIANAARQIEQAAAESSDITGTSGRPSPEQARAELNAAQEQLDAIEVRDVETYEMRALLEKALQESHQRLLIVSPWIKAEVVNTGLLDALVRLLRKGVTIHIGFGISGDAPRHEPDRKAIQALQKLAAGHRTMIVGHLGNTHAKLLVSDHTAITGSFNWLSFRADRKRTYRQELGTLVRKPDYVDRVYLDRVREIEAAATRSAGTWVSMLP